MNKKIEQKVISFIESQKLIEEGDKILIALSGGPDSVFALHFFNKYKRKYKIEIAAAHLNHKLRAKDSERDEVFCKSLCKELGIEFICSHAEIKKLKEESKKSIEEIARNERYKFLEYTANQLHASKIVTAHNQDDNTETVLINLIKGTGVKGLSGIPVQRGKIIRPTLAVQKTEILQYLKERKLKYRKDKSNDENEYQRNIIRNKLLPIIKFELNPSITEAVFRTSQNLRVISSLINKQTESLFQKFVEYKDDAFKIGNKLFDESENLFIDEVIKLTLEKFLHSDITAKDIAKLKRLYLSQTGKEIKFKENYFATREREDLLLRIEKKSISGELKIKIGQTLHLEVFDISISRVKNSRFIMNQTGCEFVSIDVENPTFTLRKWKDGDKFMPLGMKNFKKISDFLTDQKIASSEKRKQLVLTYRNQIIWLVGLRIDERYKITTSTKRALKLCLN